MSVKPHGKDQLEDLGEEVHAVGAVEQGGFLPQAEHAGDDGGEGGDQRGRSGLPHAAVAQGDDRTAPARRPAGPVRGERP